MLSAQIDEKLELKKQLAEARERIAFLEYSIGGNQDVVSLSKKYAALKVQHDFTVSQSVCFHVWLWVSLRKQNGQGQKEWMYQNIAKQIQVLQKTVGEMRGQVEQAELVKEQLAVTKQENQHLLEQIDVLKRVNLESERSIAEASSSAARGELQFLKNHDILLKQEIERLTLMIMQERAEKDELKNQLVPMREENLALVKDLEDKNKIVARMKLFDPILDSIEQTVADCRASTEKRSVEIAALKLQIHELVDLVNFMKKDHQGNSSMAEDYRKVLEKFAQYKNARAIESKELEERINALSSERERLQTELRNASSHVEALTSEKAQMEHVLRRQNSDMSGSMQLKNTLETQLLQKSRLLEETRARNQFLESELEKHRIALKTFDTHLSKLDQVEQTLERRHDSINDLKDTVTKLRTDWTGIHQMVLQANRALA